jgi:excinuclease ABC subunit B
VLVGINLLREGLDLPEVSLVAILDADKEGFLRSRDSLIQTIGRAARHLSGMAILYADRVTESMRQALDETNRRREKQLRYNRKHGITPESIMKPVDTGLIAMVEADYLDLAPEQEEIEVTSPDEIEAHILKLQEKMREAARDFEFEAAARLRDRIKALKEREMSLL